ncbi:hypothetical protein PWT90_06805 [Aphanocladium album]|nr:hypothetical protein PWT90_06805 [Aphanocladium album]
MNGIKKILSRQKTNQSVDHQNELKTFRKQHRYDPFLGEDKRDAVDAALDSGNSEKLRDLDSALIQDDSPYPEVRAAVPPTDEDMPVDTIRAWVIGGILCTIVSACNVLLSMRRTPISISSTVVQLVAYPIGCAWASFVPAKTFRVFGRTFELNPGPFNVKEHTIITMMTAAGSAISYAFDILLAQEIFYDQHFKWGFQILLVLSTQAMGFGIAGVARRFLIYPSSMVWPATLVTCAVMYALHNHQAADPADTNGWKIGRYAFFLIVAGSTFVWEWVPQVFAQMFQFFNFACWIAPKNVIVNQLFGAQTGFGLIPISFDWSIVSAFLGSPLQAPAFALVNVFFGLCLVTIAAAGLSWAGPEFYRYLPISANKNYDNTVQKYNVTRILTPEFTMNYTAYQEYSPIIISPTFTLSYGMSFAALISTLVHVGLFYGPDIWRRSRDMRSEEPDVHLKLMRKYKEAPEWWFLGIFALSFAFGMIASQVWPTHLPWWSFIICIVLGAIFFIPVGTIQAITNQQTGLNVITELVVGFMLPGRPIAMMMFKCWGYMIVFYGLNYISDMKVGHYMKIPPRSMFAAQAFAVIWLSLVQVATYNFLLGNIKGICTEHQPQGLICPQARTFFNASVIWGVIGPAKMFGAGQLFAWLNWFWLIGAALPVMQYFITRRYPKSPFRYMLTPIIFGAAGQIPPATLYYLWQFVSIGLVFNWWIRRRYWGWWQQYNYTLSGALDIGNALAAVVIALALGLGNANFPDWWGNTAPYTNLDGWGNATTKVFQKGQTPLGPSSWS